MTFPRPSELTASTAGVLAGSVVALTGSVAVRAFMARALSPDELGFLLLAIAGATATGSIASLGTNPAAAQHLAERLSRGDHAGARRSARTALAVAAAAGLTGAALWWLAAPGAAPLLTRTPEGAGSLLLAWRTVTPIVPALALGLAALGVCRAWGRTSPRVVLRDGGGGVLRGLGVGAAFAAGASLLGLGAAYTAGVVLAELTFVGYGLRQGWFGLLAARRSRDRRWEPELLRRLRPFSLLEVVRQMEQWADLFLLGLLAPPAQVGYYGLARGVSRALIMILGSAGHAFLPAATGAAGGGALARVYVEARRTVLALLWPPLVLCLLAPEVPIVLLAGETYRPSAPLLQLLALGVLTEAILGYKDQTLLARGRRRAVLGLRLAGLALAMGAMVPAILAFGAVGAAAALLAAHLMRDLLLARLLRRAEGIRIRRHDLTRATRWVLALTAAGGLAVALLASTPGLGTGRLPWLSLLIAAATGVGGTLLFLLPRYLLARRRYRRAGDTRRDPSEEPAPPGQSPRP